jgi:hypothetical protein
MLNSKLHFSLSATHLAKVLSKLTEPFLINPYGLIQKANPKLTEPFEKRLTQNLQSLFIVE